MLQDEKVSSTEGAIISDAAKATERTLKIAFQRTTSVTAKAAVHGVDRKTVRTSSNATASVIMEAQNAKLREVMSNPEYSPEDM